jgi:MSHA biogenesis protein MshK
MARILIAWLGLLLALAPAAAGMRDPTRPPPGHAADPGALPPASRLTSVMVRPGGRSVAIVNGQPVRVGERLPEGVVTGIDEGGLWLRTDAGRQRLRLLPAVARKPAKTEPMEK